CDPQRPSASPAVELLFHRGGRRGTLRTALEIANAGQPDVGDSTRRVIDPPFPFPCIGRKTRRQPCFQATVSEEARHPEFGLAERGDPKSCSCRCRERRLRILQTSAEPGTDRGRQAVAEDCQCHTRTRTTEHKCQWMPWPCRSPVFDSRHRWVSHLPNSIAPDVPGTHSARRARASMSP